MDTHGDTAPLTSLRPLDASMRIGVDSPGLVSRMVWPTTARALARSSGLLTLRTALVAAATFPLMASASAVAASDGAGGASPSFLGAGGKTARRAWMPGPSAL